MMDHSDDEVSPAPRSKTTGFTMEERKLLLLLVNKYYDTVNNKKVDGASMQAKTKAWESIGAEYLNYDKLVRLSRTPQQLKRCWENMKCKAKRGDPVSVKLLRYGETQYRQKNNETTLAKIENSSTLDPLKHEPFDCFSTDDKFMEKDGFDEVADNDAIMSDESANESLSPKINNLNIVNTTKSDCSHCNCDKEERSAKMELLAFKKRNKHKLFNLKLQLLNERKRREREIHRLAVHELTLKVENERRRAEILDRELKSQL